MILTIKLIYEFREMSEKLAVWLHSLSTAASSLTEDNK